MTSLNALTSLQNNTVDFVDGLLPMLKMCEPHQGRFTPEELEAIRTKAPAVLVGTPAVRGVEAMGGGMVRISVMTYLAVITKDTVQPATATTAKRTLRKDEGAAVIVSSLLLALPTAALGAGVEPCEGIAADNLTTLKVSKDGVAIWGMHWTNTVTLRSPEEDGATLAALYYSEAPKIGAAHIDDYELLIGQENEAAS